MRVILTQRPVKRDTFAWRTDRRTDRGIGYSSSWILYVISNMSKYSIYPTYPIYNICIYKPSSPSWLGLKLFWKEDIVIFVTSHQLTLWQNTNCRLTQLIISLFKMVSITKTKTIWLDGINHFISLLSAVLLVNRSFAKRYSFLSNLVGWARPTSFLGRPLGFPVGTYSGFTRLGFFGLRQRFFWSNDMVMSLKSFVYLILAF